MLYILYAVIFIYQLTACKSTKISFQNFCRNNSNPGVIPGSGDDSSDIFLLSDALDNGPLSSSSSYPAALNCTITLNVERGYQLLVVFKEINLRNSSLDKLTVTYGDERRERVLSGRFKCPRENCSNLIFESGRNSHNITFAFLSANVTVPSEFTGFSGVYTVFNTIDSKTKSCKGGRNRFLCLNGHCVEKHLVCNSHNNCGDRSDEIPCSYSKMNAIIIIITAITLVVIFVPMFCFLANYGTRRVIKFVTVPNRSVPLYPTADDDDERTRLLTSSGPPSGYCTSGSYDKRHSCNYGRLSQDEENNLPSGSGHVRSASLHEGIQRS